LALQENQPKKKKKKKNTKKDNLNTTY
jgi:hypothetical protein